MYNTYFQFHHFCFRTVTTALLILTVIWLANLSICIPVLFIYNLDEFYNFENGEKQHYCNEHFPGATYRKLYTMVIFNVFYTIPLVIIAICYYVMATNNRLEWRPGSTGAVGRQALSRRRIAKTVAVVVTTFALCWLPLHLIQVVTTFYGPASEPVLTYNIIYVLKIVAHTLSYANSAANPFIYAFMSNDFRRVFKETFVCCCKKSDYFFKK